MITILIKKNEKKIVLSIRISFGYRYVVVVIEW